MKLDGQKIEPVVRDLVARLVEHGHETLIVGGAVRDLLLGITPKDYDIATAATPEEVKRVFGRQSRIIGRRFRLVHVMLGGHLFEVSTFRRQPTADERSTRDGDDGVMLWSDNEYGTRDEDAVRRDFTVNAMYYDPLKDEIIDTVGGLADIKAKVVRMIGDPEVRLAEDPVRLLRALKLVALFDFKLEPALAAAIRKLAPSIALSSKSRCFEELLKILAKPCATKTFAVCQEYGVLEHFWPNLAAGWNSPAGKLMRNLLQMRDERVAAGVYAKSQTLGLATLALAFVGPSLRQGDEAPGPLWATSREASLRCREALRIFFEPYPVPKFLQIRTREVLMLMPSFFHPEPQHHVVTHPQYRYARELFHHLARLQGWDVGQFAHWPEPSPEFSRRSNHPDQPGARGGNRRHHRGGRGRQGSGPRPQGGYHAEP